MNTFSIVGMDGSGKSTALDIIVEKYIKGAQVVQPSKSRYHRESWESGHVPFGRRLIAQLDRQSLIGDRLNSKLLQGFIYSASAMVNPVYSAFLKISRNPDVFVKERDSAIEGAVYSGFYLPAAERLTAGTRLSLLTDILRHPLPGTAIYLDVEPSIAYARILKSVENRMWQHRKDKPHLHETVENLAALRRAYYEVLEECHRRGTDVVVLNTSNIPPKDVAYLIYLQIAGSILSCNGSSDPFHSKKVLVVK